MMRSTQEVVHQVWCAGSTQEVVHQVWCAGITQEIECVGMGWSWCNASEGGEHTCGGCGLHVVVVYYMWWWWSYMWRWCITCGDGVLHVDVV